MIGLLFFLQKTSLLRFAGILSDEFRLDFLSKERVQVEVQEIALNIHILVSDI